MRVDPFRILAALSLATFLGCGAPPSTDTAESAATPATPQEDPRIGRRVHITGCENDELVVPLVNLWNGPERSRVVGKLSGDGRPDQGLRCQGAVVIIRDVIGSFYQVGSVVGSQVGWVTEPFIGRTFDTTNCESFFRESSEAARKCSG